MPVPEGMLGRGILWAGFITADGAGTGHVPCLWIGSDPASHSGGASPEPVFLAGIVEVDRNGRATGASEPSYAGRDLGAAVEEASSLTSPSETSSQIDAATKLSWKIAERVGEVQPRTYEDLEAAGML